MVSGTHRPNRPVAGASGRKLWDKNEPLDALIEQFTVGDDYQLDRALVAADCVASLAHATMLAAIEVITPAQLEELRAALLEALELAQRGAFTIARADEDGHTALERFLTQRTAAGARIHTGRSRNDQVMAALRLYGREALTELQHSVLNLADALFAFAARYEHSPMPGRTHTQVAMPSTLGLWAAAFAEELLDDLALVATCYRLTNRSPLGSAAGYGAPLPLDREQVATLLGCDGPVHNVLTAANSRGKLEAATLDALDQVAMTMSRLAQDLILFSLPELGYVTLPVELCTGSSIMPHKRNPDGLELVRARSATVSALAGAVKGIVRNLPSGYHRDLQETKRPYLTALDTVIGQVVVMTVTLERLQVCESALARSLTPELFATDAAFALVQQGMAFRDAYRQAAQTYTLSGGNEARGEATAAAGAALAGRTATGTAGNLGLPERRRLVAAERQRVEGDAARAAAALTALMGRPVAVYRNPWRTSEA
jgi:argininosuccinate lyase